MPRRGFVRLSAEQVVDSLHQVAGLPLGTEEITFDPSTQQNVDAFLNLGVATRAWQLTSLSNERDRPSLSLPKAAIVVECLEAFGWRGSRQEPVSHRETDANMVQPGVVANSAMSIKLSRMTDDSYFTQLALNAKTARRVCADRLLNKCCRASRRARSCKRLLTRSSRNGTRALRRYPCQSLSHNRIAAL